MKNHNKNLLILVALFLFLVFTFNLVNQGGLSSTRETLAFSDFLTKIESKQVNDVKIQGRNIEGHLTDGRAFSVYAPDYPHLIDHLNDAGVHIDASPPDTRMNSLLSIFISWFPMILLIGVWVFFMRQMQSGGGKAMGFGKSKAKLVSSQGPKVTFKDVAGINEAKEELVEIVDFLRDPGKFQKLGGKIPKGCLLIGPPGGGKTLLAKAIAGEANVPFFSISGSDFVEMFVGVGASRVRDMFEQGKRNAPCIIFIDEIDAVGRHRGVGLGGGNDEREQTLNQMLVEMDGFDTSEGVVIVAATNRPDVLDKALLRPGRFDRQVTISYPDIAGREQILSVHMKKIRCDNSVSAEKIARATPGLSGAALANLVNEAALIAARRNKKVVSDDDFELAKDKVLMGVERRSKVMSDFEKKLTAYHEAGHALVALHTKYSDPIYKATIIPRGSAGGFVARYPEEDRGYQTREEMHSHIEVAMGGRIAEELILGHDKVTNGASQDIKVASHYARAMVLDWGWSKKVGPIYFGSGEEDVYSRTSKAPYSEKLAEVIDAEIKLILDDAYQEAEKIIKAKIKDLHLIAEELLKRETLTGKQIEDLLAGKSLDDIKPKKSKTPKSKTINKETKSDFGNGADEAEKSADSTQPEG